MGKQAKIKAERRKAREASRQIDEATIAKWSQIPKEALSGPCNRTECTLAHCLDPWVTQVSLANDVHDGPLVFVNYAVYGQNPLGAPEHHMRVNGRPFGTLPTGAQFREDPSKHQAAMRTIQARLNALYGAGADLAFFEHIARSPQVLEAQGRPNTPPVQA